MNDHRLLGATLDAVVVERPEPTEQEPQHLCLDIGRAGTPLDKGYDNTPSRAALEERGYTEHIRRIGLEKVDEATGQKKHPARRWVVERTFSWLCRWRGISVRWEKKPRNYLAGLKLASVLLWFRRAWREGSALLR